MADDLEGHASIKREITGCEAHMSIKDRTIPGAVVGKPRHMRTQQKANEFGKEKLTGRLGRDS